MTTDQLFRTITKCDPSAFCAPDFEIFIPDGERTYRHRFVWLTGAAISFVRFSDGKTAYGVPVPIALGGAQ